LLARRLGADHDDDPITALYSTPLARAVQTAQPAAKVLGLEIRHLPAWHYPHYGVADGRTWYEVYAECPIPHPALRPDVPIAEGAETVTAFRASVRTAISEMVRAHPGEHILVFGSFENVLAAHEELLGLPPDSRCRSKIALDHTGITVWDLTPAPWSPAGQRAVLVRHNDSSHLPAPQRRSRFRAAPAVGS
jgi:probable phosphoglycerate mutase